MRGEVAQDVKALQLVRHLLPGEVNIGHTGRRFRRLVLVVEIDHRIKTVAIIIALHHSMSPRFAGHPERRRIQRFIRIGFLPLRQRGGGLGF